MTPAPLQVGQAPSELALNSAGFTPLAFAKAVRIGSSSPVYVAGLLRREPRIAAWSIDTTPSRPDTEPWISELLPEPATPVRTTSTPSGMSTSTSWRLWVSAPRTSRAPVEARTEGFRDTRWSRCRPVSLRLVLDDQHGVALVAQLQQQVVHPLDVMRVQPDRRLVEDVGDVGERGPEVADHLGALRLAAGQRARRPVEREVAQPDFGEGVEQVLQPGEQRSHRRLVELPD